MILQAIIAVIASVLIGELTKTLLQVVRKEDVHLFQLGGMPSSHSAAVSSLVLATYLEEGSITILVLACVVFGWIVLTDAYGVRWEVTRHSNALNTMLKTKDYKRTGHTRKQVIAGVILGILVTMVVYLF